LLLKFFSIAKGRIFVPLLFAHLSLLSGKASFFTAPFFSLSPFPSFLSLSLSRKKTNKLAPLSKLGTEKKKEKSKDKKHHQSSVSSNRSHRIFHTQRLDSVRLFA